MPQRFEPYPDGWVEWVNAPQNEREMEAVRLCVERGRLYGGAQWVKQTAAALGPELTLRPPGRPKKTTVPDTFSSVLGLFSKTALALSRFGKDNYF